MGVGCCLLVWLMRPEATLREEEEEEEKPKTRARVEICSCGIIRDMRREGLRGGKKRRVIDHLREESFDRGGG